VGTGPALAADEQRAEVPAAGGDLGKVSVHRTRPSASRFSTRQPVRICPPSSTGSSPGYAV
jgi:hypothetical protein